MATIIVRALDSNWDPRCGNGLGSFLQDIEAVAQILAQRLRFLLGEWWENTADGTPLFQSLLGHSTTLNAVALILRQRILGTPYVTGIQSFQVTYAPRGRAFTFSAVITTQFGPLAIANTNQATGPLSWRSMTGAQWVTLTSGQFSSLVP